MLSMYAKLSSQPRLHERHDMNCSKCGPITRFSTCAGQLNEVLHLHQKVPPLISCAYLLEGVFMMFSMFRKQIGDKFLQWPQKALQTAAC